MNTLDEIEDAVDKLPPTQQEELLLFLNARINGRAIRIPNAARAGRSVLEIAPVSVGEVLQPLSTEDDLLGEMLEARA